MPDPITVPPEGKTLSQAYHCAERAYRRALRVHDFTEVHLRVLDVILSLSISLGRSQCRLPRDGLIGELTGLDKSRVSEALEWLARQNVIERSAGGLLALLPPSGPPGWTLARRVRECPELVELERWLERLDPSEPELLPAPASLSAALREVFVESSRVESVESASSSWVGPKSAELSRPGCPPGSGSGEETQPGPALPKVAESATAGQKVAKFATPPPQKVAESATFLDRSDRVDPDRLIDSRKDSPRVDPDRSRVADSATYRGYVRQRLYDAVGWQEARGRSALAFERMVREQPELLDELIGVALEKKRLAGFTRTRSANPIAAWLNASCRSALSVQSPKPQ